VSLVGSNRSSCIPPRDASVLSRATVDNPLTFFGEGGERAVAGKPGERVGKAMIAKPIFSPSFDKFNSDGVRLRMR